MDERLAVSSIAAPGSRSGLDPRRASAADISGLKSMLADAFFQDPLLEWLMPDDRSRRARLRRFFAIELRHVGLPRGQVWTTDDLAGAAVSLPPHAWHAPLRAVLLEGRVFGVHLPRAAKLQIATDRCHPRGPHYYLRDIGVRPESQGQGLGSALMGPTLDLADRERLPVYLEASSGRSAALYERLGFRVIEERRIAGSPPLRLMARPPRPKETGQ